MRIIKAFPFFTRAPKEEIPFNRMGEVANTEEVNLVFSSISSTTYKATLL